MYKANYREGLNFKDLEIGDTIYCKEVVDGSTNSYLLKIIEFFSEKTFNGLVLSTSHNSNKWEEPSKLGYMSCGMSSCFLIDEKGFWYSFDALGRISNKRTDQDSKTHPSYGMISVNRFSGGLNTYFGSSIKHDGGISIKISQADVTRNLNKDWFHGDLKPYIEVNLSYSQFAEMITSGMNTQGTPCTIKSIAGERVEECDFSNKRTEFNNEFEKDMTDLKKKLDSLVEDSKTILEAKKAPNKGERDLILKEINDVTGTLTNHFTFLSSQWSKQMERTVKEAKAEIEGFQETKIRDLGIQALKGENLELLD